MSEKVQSLNELAKEIHENAIKHGWWEEEKNFGELIALCHSELSEALEEFRNGHNQAQIYGRCNNTVYGRDCPRYSDGMCRKNINKGWTPDIMCKTLKPEGIPIELADVMIRILDMCGKYEINIEEAIKVKHEYNKTRPYKHDKKI